MSIQTDDNKNFKSLLILGGLSYLGVIATGVYAEGIVRGSLIDQANALVTMKNIGENIGLMRLAAINDVFILVFDIIAAMCLYVVLSGIDKNLSRLALLFRLIAIGILGTAGIFAYFPVILHNGNSFLTTFNEGQIAALGLLSIKLHNLSYHFSLILFAINNLLLGIIMLKSKEFIKPIAFATILFGLCYFTNSFSWFIAPEFQKIVSGLCLKTAFFCELSLSLWMIYLGAKNGHRPKPIQAN